MNTIDHAEWVSVAEAAFITRVPLATLHRWTRTGVLETRFNEKQEHLISVAEVRELDGMRKRLAGRGGGKR